MQPTQNAARLISTVIRKNMGIKRDDCEYLEEQYLQIIISLEDCMSKLYSFSNRLKNQNAIENLCQGVIRRGFINAHCLRRIYQISPPTRTNSLTFEEGKDINVFLLTFLFNVSGIIDNLSWIWFYENNIHEKEDPEKYKFNVHLFNKDFKKYLTDEVKKEIQKFDNWLIHIKTFRDPIAHRIPPYVIPYFLDEEGARKHKLLVDKFNIETDIEERDRLLKEMDNCGVYEPAYMHSASEGSPIVAMHAQLLTDTNTIIELVKIIKNNL
jgi:hypothetical protein